MESSQRALALEHKTVAGGKTLQVACATCTFLNAADVSFCAICGADIIPPTHDVQVDGSWKCGGCETVNLRAVKECSHCHLPFYSLVTTAVPAQIFCSRCGFLNDGDNLTCVQCDYTIRSTLEKISTNLRDSTNFLARDMGVNIHVKCPGCLVVCYVPPATACLRCGSCHTYFASPSVGEVTNFHMNRLASSISSSFMGFFGKRGGQEGNEASLEEEAQEAPVGRMIAAGQDVVKSPHQSSVMSDASELSSSLHESEVSGDETEEKLGALQAQECVTEPRVQEKPPAVEETMETHTNTQKYCDDGGCDGSSSSEKEHPMLARSMPLRAALPLPRQELIEVEGDIVEL